MDSLATPARPGVVLRHPERPIPSRRHLLTSTTPAMATLVLTGLITTWWAGRTETGPHWFSLAWIPIAGTAWLVLTTTRAPRPFLAHTGQGTDLAAARHTALREHRVPDSSSIRIGAAIRSCGQLEAMALLLTAGATAAAGAVLRPELPWLPVLITWGALIVTGLLAAGRSWAYLRLLEHHTRPSPA